MCSCHITHDWKTWKIPTGQHYCNQSYIYNYETKSVEFLFRFDSSAIYEIPNSQVNKLYGLCPTWHFVTQESYRFGWKYFMGKIKIYIYVHDDWKTIKQEFSTVDINTINTGKIELVDSGAFFYLNDKSKFVKFSTDVQNKYSIMLPFFGGTTSAPQPIYIHIKQLKP